MAGPSFHPLIASSKDGLLSLKTDPWILSAIKSLGKYLEVYSYKLPALYNHLIYLDINPGTGMIEVEKTRGNVLDTSLIALSSPITFHRYIFWEPNEIHAQALRIRVNRNFKDKNILILGGSIEKLNAQLCKYIPHNSKGIKPWVFCNIHPRFGMPDPALFSALLEFDATIYFNLLSAEQTNDFWQLMKKSKITDPELVLRANVKNLEVWASELYCQLKGNFTRIDPPKPFSLLFSGLLSRNRSVKRIISEVERVSTGQMQLFVE